MYAAILKYSMQLTIISTFLEFIEILFEKKQRLLRNAIQIKE